MAEIDIDPADNVTRLGPSTPAAPPISDVDPAQNTRPLSTSYTQLPRDGSPGRVRPGYFGNSSTAALGEVTGNIPSVRSGFSEGYEATGRPSVTRGGIRSMFEPEFQNKMNEHWWGPAANVVGDLVGTGVADVVGAGNSVLKLGNEALRSVGTPEPLIRDINMATQVAPIASRTRLAGVPPEIPAAIRELSAPAKPTLPELLQRQRAAPSTDPTINDAISILRRATQPTAVPPPPAPFTPSAQPVPPRQPSPTTAPSGGLLNIPDRPLPGAAPQRTEAEMLAISKGYFSPADQAVARNAMIPAGHTDSMLSILTDAVPTDPHKAIATGNTPLVQLGKEYIPLKGQPMSYDAAMTLDRRLTAERQGAMKEGKFALAKDIEEAQDKFRGKMDTVPDDGTGDPQALANVRRARQAFHQARKQGQLNDILYDASLLPEEKQNAYVRNRTTAMLRNDRKMSGWDADERASLEAALAKGDIGAVKSFGISLIKPAARAVGGFVGSPLGVPGALVGSEIGSEWGAVGAAKLRDALSKIRYDDVNKQLSQRVPPPPPGQ